jgi:hypothetical protein
LGTRHKSSMITMRKMTTIRTLKATTTYTARSVEV